MRCGTSDLANRGFGLVVSVGGGFARSDGQNGVVMDDGVFMNTKKVDEWKWFKTVFVRGSKAFALFVLKAFLVTVVTVGVAVVVIINPNYIFGWDGMSQGEMVEQLEHFEKTYVVETTGGRLEVELDIHGVDSGAENPFEAREEFGLGESWVSSAYACRETLETPFVLEASACESTYKSTLLFAGEAIVAWRPDDGSAPVVFLLDVSKAELEVQTGGFSRDGDPDGWFGSVSLSGSNGEGSMDLWLNVGSNWGTPRVTVSAFELRNSTLVVERDWREIDELGLTPVSERRNPREVFEAVEF